MSLAWNLHLFFNQSFSNVYFQYSCRGNPLFYCLYFWLYLVYLFGVDFRMHFYSVIICHIIYPFENYFNLVSLFYSETSTLTPEYLLSAHCSSVYFSSSPLHQLIYGLTAFWQSSTSLPS